MVISLPISKNYVWPVLVVFEIKATWEFHRVSYNIALALDRAVIMTMKSSSGHIFWILLRCVICWHLKVPIVTFISAHWQTFHCMFSGHVNLPVLDEKLSHHYVNPRTLFNPTLQHATLHVFTWYQTFCFPFFSIQKYNSNTAFSECFHAFLSVSACYHARNPRTFFNPHPSQASTYHQASTYMSHQAFLHYRFSPDFRFFVFLFSACKSMRQHSGLYPSAYLYQRPWKVIINAWIKNKIKWVGAWWEGVTICLWGNTVTSLT